MEIQISRNPVHNSLLDGVIPLNKVIVPDHFLNRIPSSKSSKKFLDGDDFERIIHSIIIPRLKTATSRIEPIARDDESEAYQFDAKYSGDMINILFSIKIKDGVGKIMRISYRATVVGELE